MIHPQLLCTPVLIHPELVEAVHQQGPASRDVSKAFVLSCQIFVSSQEGEVKVDYLANLPLLFPSHEPSPYLSAYQGVRLTPRLK